MNEGRFKALNKKVPALLLTAGILFSTACSDKGESVSETQAADPATSESVAETEPVSEKPSYDPVTVDYFTSEYLDMVETGAATSVLETSVKNIDLFKDQEITPTYYWKYYNGHIFIYAETLCNVDSYCSIYPNIDPNPTIYEYDLDGNLISSLRLIDFWAQNFPNSNMYNRSSFIQEKNLFVNVQDGGFIVGCDKEYCMYSFKDAKARKIVMDHGMNPGSYNCGYSDGYFDGELFVTLTIDDQDWYLESFNINGDHDSVLVNSKGLEISFAPLWSRVNENIVAVNCQEHYEQQCMTVYLDDLTWTTKDGVILSDEYFEPIDGYYQNLNIYTEDGKKIIDIDDVRYSVKGKDLEYSYYPDYTGCDDEGWHFIACNDRTAEYITLYESDKPEDKEIITLVVPNGTDLYLLNTCFIEDAVRVFNQTSDKYYCKVVELNNVNKDTLALEYETALSSDCPPDIVVSPTHYLLLDNSELCADMSKYVEQNIGESAMMSVFDGCRDTKTDALYCLPFTYYIEALYGAPDYCDDSYENYLAMLKDTSYDPLWGSFELRYSQQESGTEAYMRLLLEDQLDLYFEKGYFDADADVFYDMADFMLLNNYQMITATEYDQGTHREKLANYTITDPNNPWMIHAQTGDIDMRREDFVGLPSTDGRGAVVKLDCCLNVKAGSEEKEGVNEFLRFLYAGEEYDSEFLSFPVCPTWGDPDDVIDKGLGELTIQPATDRIIIDIIIEETMKYLDDVDGTVKLEDVAKRINERVGGYLAAYEKQE